MAKSFEKVAVLAGGNSAEREVSLNSGRNVLEGLLEAKIDAQLVDFQGTLASLRELQGFDYIFIVLHGPVGEDGTVQGTLDIMGVPYTGSGVMASALAMDKLRSKWLWQGCGLPVPRGILVSDEADIEVVLSQYQLPLCVKPLYEGSSVGVTKVKAQTELKPAIKAAQQYGAVMVEEWVEGKEYTVAIVGNDVLPSICIETPREFYDYEAKYLVNTTQYHCPSGLDDQEEKQLQQLALAAYRALGCEGWGRVDFMRNAQTGEFYLIELNTAPGMTKTSLPPKAAKQAGWSFSKLVERILRAKQQ